ncbi:hypothetical protein JCM16418A_00540 [Paenibacillus pini]
MNSTQRNGSADVKISPRLPLLCLLIDKSLFKEIYKNSGVSFILLRNIIEMLEQKATVYQPP